MKRWVKVEGDGGAVVCQRCLVADTPLRRLKGLLGRPGLDAGEGLLLRPVNMIHTSFMRFPIDVVFLDRNDNVVGVAADVRPWRFAGRRRARAVLELAAGEARRVGLRAGMQLRIVEAA